MAFENLFKLVPVDDSKPVFADGSNEDGKETNVSKVTQDDPAVVESNQAQAVETQAQDAPAVVESNQAQAVETQAQDKPEDASDAEYSLLLDRMEKLEKRIADLTKHAATVDESDAQKVESTIDQREEFKGLRELNYLISKDEMKERGN